MKKLFEQLPAPLKVPLLVRSSVGLLALILFISIWIYSKEFIFAFPCLVLAVFLFVNSAVMIYNVMTGKYVCLYGRCTAVERTMIRKRTKTITMEIEGMSVVLPIRFFFQKFDVGMDLVLYVSDKTPVYEKGNEVYLNNYYALALDREVDSRGNG